MATIHFDEKFNCPKCGAEIESLETIESSRKSGYPKLEVTVYLCPECKVLLGIKK